MDSQSDTSIFVFGIVVSIVVIIGIVLIYIFRFTLFASFLTNDGYGTYEVLSTTECKTESGFCGEIGYQYTTENCVRNPITGWGCLNKNQQTFASRITRSKCTPKCQSSIWKTISSDVCVPTDSEGNDIPIVDGKLPVGVCLNVDAVGNFIDTLTCVAHDSSGDNGCIWTIDPSIPLPSGCVINPNGTTATCSVGSIVYNRTKCIPPKSMTRCGVYGISVDSEDEKGANFMVVKECPAYNSYVFASEGCFNLDPEYMGEELTQYSQLYQIGWQPIDMNCFDGYDADGTNPPNPSTCLPFTNLSTPDQFQSKIGTQQIVYQEGSQLKCVRPCMFYNPAADSSEGPWTDKLKQMVLVPWVIQGSNLGGEPYYYLSLKNIPQSVDPNDTLIKGVYNDPTPNSFTDYFGDPRRPLKTTECMLYSPSTIQNNPLLYQLDENKCGLLPPSDTIQHLNSIIMTNSLLCIFHPYGILRRSYPNTPYTFGHIVATQGEYYGYLNVIMDGGIKKLVWIQAERNEIIHPNRTLFYIEDDGVGLSIGYLNPDTGYTLSLLPNIPNEQGGYLTNQTILPVIIPSVSYYNQNGDKQTRTIINGGGIADWDQFDLLNRHQENRWNPFSCNAFYSYPPPQELEKSTSE